MTDNANPIPAVLDTVNYRVAPPDSVNAVVVKSDGQFQNDHTIVGNNGVVTVGFYVDPYLAGRPLRVRLSGLVSRAGDHDGYSPISVQFNNTVLVQKFTVPGGGFGPWTNTFPVPPSAIVQGFNTVTLQVASDAKTYFWLYATAVDILLDEAWADLTKNPITTKDLSVQANQGGFQNDHWRFGNNAVFSTDFNVTINPSHNPQAAVVVTGLVSRAGDQDGYSPFSLSINGKAFLTNQQVAPGGWAPENGYFPIPVGALLAGKNNVSLQIAGDARTYFWLYRFSVIS